MSYNISWLVDKQVILAEMTGDITLSLIGEKDILLIEHMRAGEENQLVHIIFDLTKVNKFPLNIAQLNQVTNGRHEPNMGWIIVINNNRMIQFVGNMITQLTQTRFRNFETVEEAIDFLKTQDTRLDSSLLVSQKDNGAAS